MRGDGADWASCAGEWRPDLGCVWPLDHVHPHQLRHTLATQAINRGMRLEAIATMLGHRSLRMTLTYARIANKTVADEYATASAKIDALDETICEGCGCYQTTIEFRPTLQAQADPRVPE